MFQILLPIFSLKKVVQDLEKLVKQLFIVQLKICWRNFLRIIYLMRQAHLSSFHTILSPKFSQDPNFSLHLCTFPFIFHISLNSFFWASVFQVKARLIKMGQLNSMNIFLRQEIDRMQKVITVVRNSLNDLKLAIEGTIIMSEASINTFTMNGLFYLSYYLDGSRSYVIYFTPSEFERCTG